LSSERLNALDGWRGISIALVLAAHLLPLGPKVLKLNHVAGVLGMAIFFILSGFLITRLLLSSPPISHFLIRRFFRILPLAWLYLLVCAAVGWIEPNTWVEHFSFTANIPPIMLGEHTAHFWSLCVEVQFYVFMALTVAVFRTRALYAMPCLALLITANRIHHQAPVDIQTLLRADEILAGCSLALAYAARHDERIRRFFSLPSWLVLPVLVMACHPQGGWLNYLRPYLALYAIGGSLLAAQWPGREWLLSRPLAYLARISYALYVIHAGVAGTWLGAGEGLEKYVKRPLLFLVTFLLAHLSTFYVEERFIQWGKRLTRNPMWPRR
jgi:peptidoglycan/LPS O-acetylase OafA/YrhL